MKEIRYTGGSGDVARCAFVFQTRWVVVPLLRGEGDNPVHPVHLGHPASDNNARQTGVPNLGEGQALALR